MRSDAELVLVLRRRRRTTQALRCGGFLAVLAASACTDPQARYDAFVERTADLRGADAGGAAPGDRFDWSGSYLLALSTTLAPAQPILFAVEAELSAGLRQVDLRIQPLTTDAADDPRTPVGEAYGVTAVPYEQDGTFSIDLGELTIPGAANPISGSDIVAQVQLRASTLEASSERPTAFCGEATGTVSEPLVFDLDGSTFGALVATDVDDAPLLTSCP